MASRKVGTPWFPVVLVCVAALPAAATNNLTAEAFWHEQDFRLSQAAYDHPKSCYDREYLFQWAEMDRNIHRQALAQVAARINCIAGTQVGNLIVSQSDPILMFNTDPTPGQAFDGIFYWTGRGLNWDPYGHNPASKDPLALLPCTPDPNGYNTSAAAYTALNYYEWCQDHNKPLEVAPFGDVAGGGPATLPSPNIFTNGAWYGGSPYLGPNATTRASGPTDNLQPANTHANPASERGFAFMWHSHNEREITTNNVFPGGMLMMRLVDSREFVIDESN